MLLDHTYLLLNLWDMFVCCGSVEYNTKGCKFVFQRKEFAIHEHVSDCKASCSIDGLHVLGRFDQLDEFPVTDMFCGSELDVITYCCKEWDLVDKEEVA